MNRISQTIFLIAILLCTKITAQQTNNLSYLTISEALKTDANAVVRLQKTTVTVTSATQLIVKEKRIITVLNKLGKTHVNAYKHYDKDTKITKLSAIIYDALGKKVKKYSKGNFTDVSAVSGGTLYSDSRVKVLEYTPTTYPYTVVIESEYKNSSTGFIPKWFPLEGYYLSVEKNVYELHNPQNISFRKKEKNLSDYSISNTSSGNNLVYTLENQEAIKYERGTVNYDDFAPNVSIALNEFSLKGVQGKAANWKEFGSWMYNNLIKERNQLPVATITKIKSLVKNVKDPIEKAKIVYKYVQDKTRYISVQIDIGGWEPIAANKVDEVGYGDCKGLTNYTKALLDAVGIESYHTIVYASNNKNIDKNFTALQGNHMILNIPNNGNDVWLECTSQTIPFGFLGDFTDDRDVLVITPQGGVIKRTSSYINDENLQVNNANITLLPNGDMSATIERKSYGIQYNDKYHIENNTKKENDKYYKSNNWDYINNLEIKKLKHLNNKKEVVFTEQLEVAATSFASIKENSYLFKINVFNKITGIPKKYRNRKRSLEIDRGFTDKDSFIFKIPEGYTINILPTNRKINTKFGDYIVSFEKIDETSFIYKREFSLKKGIFPKEEYKAYRKFRKTVAKYDNLRTEILKQ